MITLDWQSLNIKITPHKGRALFATNSISPGTVIGDYLGKVVHPEEEEKTLAQNGLYGMTWDDKISFLPEKSNSDHILLINHSCAPNCGIYPFRGHILFVSLRQIFKDEELTISYMIEPDPDSKVQYICLCGESICKGSMYANPQHSKAFWEDFIKTTQEPYLASLPPYGQSLTALASYPQDIEDNPIWDLYGNTHLPPINIDLDSMPDITWLRDKIRTTGKNLKFTKLNFTVLGIIYPNNVILKTNDLAY